VTLVVAAALHAAAIRKLSNAFSGMLQRYVGSKIYIALRADSRAATYR